ncbi:MAG: hypothetical protein GY781_20545 [Gammaproteobacteria bacterium]|nr:hypothetical protein [Gammaproteobacteria bacterium]
MRKRVTFAVMCLVIISILATGCQTTSKKSAGIGSGIGALLGAGIGALLGDPGLGMAIGAGAGTLGGAVVGDQLEKKRVEAEKAELERQLEPEIKAESGEGKNYIEGHNEYVKKRIWIDTSQKERVWVEERVEDDRRIEGHYEDRLLPSGYWEEYEEKIWVPSHHE